MLDHAISKIASGRKLGLDATKKIPGEGFKRDWPLLIANKRSRPSKINILFGKRQRL
jgi:3-polyprenyl-4-hydroxybenzoate decarboxylase